MEYDSNGPILKPLLALDGQPSFQGTTAAFLPFPDGLLAYEHALQTLHSAVPSADTIYISLQDETQKTQILARLASPVPLFPSHNHSDEEHHSPHQTPKLEFIPDLAGYGKPGNDQLKGLLKAHTIYPDSRWPIMSCEFPLLPPPALQQLVLEYQDPVTCFVREDGLLEPLLGIWGSEALKNMYAHVVSKEIDENILRCVVEEAKGKLVKPLREEWIVKPETESDREGAMMTWREIRGGS
ncbi:hypothetical protein BKA64DRAFT_152825 [Cadophora sp. MPI-SDFR-AT-0126]|nr:hypothetical protein BKA64DRAFT_152825 [Leotiomycetes sp. MPI-SDFR-AT-0126]